MKVRIRNFWDFGKKSPSLLGRENQRFKKKRLISKNGFEKNDPACWATFSPKSLKIVANARRPLRGPPRDSKNYTSVGFYDCENPCSQEKTPTRVRKNSCQVSICHLLNMKFPTTGVSWGAQLNRTVVQRARVNRKHPQPKSAFILNRGLPQARASTRGAAHGWKIW